MSAKPKISKEIEIKICEDYINDNLFKTVLAKKYNVCRSTVLNILNKYNLNKITNETQICIDYKNNMSKIDIGKKHNIHRDTVTIILKKHNANEPSNIYVMDKLEIVDDYKEGLTKAQIMDKHDICRDAVNLVLKNNNVKSKGRKISRKNYKVDESFFEKIDTKEKAYILGFLYADGCVIKPKVGSLKLILSLQERDSYILKKINIIMKNTTPLYFSKKRKDSWQNQLFLKVISDKIVNDLIKVGVTFRKTWTLKYPFFIKDQFQGHFIRGLMDGDGWVFINKSGSGGQWGICGHLKFCQEICTYLKSRNIDSKVNEHKNKTHRFGSVTISNFENLQKIYNFMYDDCEDLFLTRKMNKFKKITYKTKELSL